MQDLFGSVRRSLVFRPAPETHGKNDSPPLPLPTPTALVEKINSCIRKSRVFSKPSSPSPAVAPPIRWRKGELIGCGAFGRVYMGMNLDSGELLAVKQVLIAASGASKEKAQAHVKELEEEVKLLKNLSHPNIVRYLGTVTEEGTLNILLEFVPGGSISSLLGKFGSFPEAVLRTYTKQLLLGLEYLHNNGIMHRDIKGANILVDNKGCIKLADFGASKQVVELATISGAKSMKGTPYWMAPEVILQTGHSFSADIWSVGCTVIEMATGKPPWSQQYQEVAALFYIGTTKSHPPIPEHLSVEAKDFLLKCLQKEPNLRPAASELLKHPFVTVEHVDGHPIIPAVTEKLFHQNDCCTPSSLQCSKLQGFSISTCPDSADICNLGSLTSVCTEQFTEGLQVGRTKKSEDDMSQNGKDDFVQNDVKDSSPLVLNCRKSWDDMCELSNDWGSKLSRSPEQKSTMQIEKQVNMQVGHSTACIEGENHFPVVSGPVSEDEDELTESKIRAFLDEKALELKKLQTPLYEEFYNSLNAACSSSFVEHVRDETPPNYLKLPPKSRSPSRCLVGVPSPTDAVSTASPGSSNKQVSGISNTSDQVLQDNSLPLPSEQKGLVIDSQQETISPSLSFSERQKKWKEELDQELERKREMMRQAGVVGKTSSPKDRALSRQRDRTRFASPGK